MGSWYVKSKLQGANFNFGLFEAIFNKLGQPLTLNVTDLTDSKVIKIQGYIGKRPIPPKVVIFKQVYQKSCYDKLC